MAVLKDLIVHGSSRFLNKIYASQIQAESGIFNKLIAKDATMENATVVGLLDVQGQLHTNAWTNSNIATIDGSFYITPTISSAEGTASNISATTIQFVPRNNTFAVVSSLYYYDTSAHEGTWLKYSKVLVTGQVQLNGEWIPLGTILGYLNADGTATSLVIAGAEDNKHRASPVLAQLVANGVTTSTSLNYRNLKVSLYQRSSSSSNNADAYKYPLGIFMTAMGTNGKTFLDIYGGGNVLTTTYGGYADPNVRIGNLSGLPVVGNQTPVGWGIYTTNGYFKGTVAADNGYIGGASISNGVLTVPAANVSGELTAATINGSKITANTITASQIASNAITADELAANAVTSAKIKAGEVKATNIASNAVTADKLDATTINASNKLTVGAMTTDTQTSIENKNIYNNKFYQYKKDIIVYGDSNKYYPVYFNNTSGIYSQNDTHRISLYRNYNQQAPNDWNTSTHKGGLTLNIKWNYGGWGGATYNCEITEFTELYSTMVGDVQVAVGSGMTSAIFLRGGGETGALYHIYCDVPIETARYNGTFPAIGNNENTGTDYMYTGSYHWKYATPLTTPNTIHIKSLIAKNTAVNYITDIDSNKGITIKPADTSGNDYLQINSSAINFYRNNVETLKIEDSAIRVGKLGDNLRNVYITDSAVQIRNNEAILAEYGSSIKLYQPTTTTVAVEISSTGASFNGNVKATSLSTGTKTASATGKGAYIDKDGNIYVGNGSTNNFTVTNTGTVTATDAHITGEITATSGSIASSVTIGAGGVSLSTVQSNASSGKEAYDLQYSSDTRNTNENPQYYITNYPRKQVNEFKSASVIGLTTGSGYCALTTIVPWGNSSGGYPKQEANFNGKRYWRQGTSATAWSAWVDASAVATSYITNIDSNKGITIKPVNTSGNDYLQINSSSIDFYRGAGTNGAAVSVMGLSDDSFRIGVATQRNIHIDTDSVDIRNGTIALAQFLDDKVVFYDGNDNASTNTVASFGEDGAIIGKDSESHLKMDNRSLSLIQFDRTAPYFLLSDLRKSDGWADLEYEVELHRQGQTIQTNVGYTSLDGVLVYLNGNQLPETDFEKSLVGSNNFLRIILSNNASSGTVKIKYKSQSPFLQYFDFGGRSVTDCPGERSASFGTGHIVKGAYGFAEGQGNEVAVTAGHAEGISTKASGAACHVEGYQTEAVGLYSHAQNCGTKTYSDSQTAIGKYNETDVYGKYAFIVGNGTADNARSNAYVITWDGDEHLALNTSATSGTIDGDLYTAITALGWGNGVMV